MAPDSFKNLGFGDDPADAAAAAALNAANVTPSQTQPKAQNHDKPPPS
jgi:hypothetical protein